MILWIQRVSAVGYFDKIFSHLQKKTHNQQQRQITNVRSFIALIPTRFINVELKGYPEPVA